MARNESHLDTWRAVCTTHAAVTTRLQEALASADLPPLSWYELLHAIDRSPERSPRMGELAEWLTLSKGGVTKLVDRLEEAGYLSRVSSQKDRRSLRTELTDAGEKVLEEMHAIASAELERHLGSLTAREGKDVVAALERVTASTCDAEGPEAARAA